MATDHLDQALRRFKLAVQAEAHQREREQEALRFQLPENHWPEDVKNTRKAQTVNGVPIPARPMLSIPKLDQPIQLILNAERQAHLGVQVHPLDAAANDDTAEVLQGLYRRIEVDSRAGLARSWGFERAVKAGRGVYRVLKEYDPNGGHPSDQRIVVKRVLHQGSVYLDPFAQEPDWSDGEWAFVVEDMPLAKFTRLYGQQSALTSYTDEELMALGNEHPSWIGGDTEESRTIRVAEYFYVEYAASKVEWADPAGKTQSRPDEQRRVRWCKITAVEELESGEWEGQYIPLIPVIGREVVPFDGERRWMGIIEPNMGAQRMFDYAASGAVEAAALEPKAPFDIDPDEIEGFEAWWQEANTRNFPYLPRHKFKNGREFGPVQRMQADMSKVQMNGLLLQQAADFLHAGTGAYEPTLGQQSAQIKSGRQALALQQQHEAGNSNWLDSLAEISLTYEAKVILDLIPHIYDRPGRVARILGLEDQPRLVMLNQPYQEQQGQPQPLPQGQPPPEGALHYDLAKGRYGVTVAIGKAYKSRLEAGSDALTQLMQSEPALVPVVGPEWAKYQDFPGAQTIADLLKKWRDHQFPFMADPNEHPDVMGQASQAMAENQQLKGQLQQASQIIQGRTLEKQIDAKTKIQTTAMQEAAETQRHREDNETKLAVAELGAKMDRLALFLEERARVGMQIADSDQAHQDRAHELGLAAMQHRQALQAGQQDAAAASAQSAQDHGQALEQGDQQIGGQMAVQAAQPEPADGGADA